jgi:hypothetical protein
MSLTVGQLTAYLDVDDSAYDRKLDRAERRFDNFGGHVMASTRLLSAGVGGPGGLALIAAAVAGAMAPLAGAVAVLPAMAAAGGAAMATLAIGTQGFGDALAASDPEEFAAALDNLAPSAAALATAVRDLRPAFGDLRLDVQQHLFAGLAEPMKWLAELYLPALRHGFVGIGTALNEGAMGVASFFAESTTLADTQTIFENTRLSVSNLMGSVLPLLQAFRDLAAVGSEFLPGLASGATGAAESFAAFVASARETGQLREFIQGGLDAFRDLGVVIGAVVEGLTGALGPFALMSGSLSLLADNAGLVTGVIQVALPAFLAYRLAVIAAGVAQAGMAVMTAVQLVPAMISAGAAATATAVRMAAAWLIALGPIPLVIAAVIGLVVLIVKNWDTIKAATERVFTAIGGFLRNTWDTIKTTVSQTVEAVKVVISTVWGTIEGLVRGYVTAWVSVVKSVWGGVTGVMSGIVGAVKGAISGLGSIGSTVSGYFAAAKAAAVGKMTELLGWLGGLGGRVLGAVGSLGGVLAGAGRSVIDGFIGGITGAFGRVRDTLSRLTSMLPDWKGPRERDEVILRDAGQLVIRGFDRGLRSQFPRVKTTLGDMTDLIGMHVAPRLGAPDYVQQRLGIPAVATSTVRREVVVVRGETNDELALAIADRMDINHRDRMAMANLGAIAIVT